MTNVQIAIRNPSYAGALRDLLVADGQHCVHVVDDPSPAIDGVVVADESIVLRLTKTEGFGIGRYIVFAQRLDFDANRLFESGIRYVIQAGSPPDIGRLIVLAAERRLSDDEGQQQRSAADRGSLFDPADELFLRALRIDFR